MGSRIALVLLVLGLASSRVDAAIVEYRATGYIVEVEDEAGVIPFAQLDQPFEASLFVDPDVSDASEFNDVVGNYPQGPGTGLFWTVGSVVFSGQPIQVTVVNDLGLEAGPIDTFQAFDNSATLTGNHGIDPGSFRLSFSLYNTSGTAFDDDSFPPLLRLEDFPDFYYLQATSPDQFHIAGAIYSLVLVPVPEPAPALLLALALAGAVLRRAAR